MVCLRMYHRQNAGKLKMLLLEILFSMLKLLSRSAKARMLLALSHVVAVARNGPETAPPAVVA